MMPLYNPGGGGGGSPGANGASAYEVAVNNGFVGTEPEWVASLEGDPGTPGSDGLDLGDSQIQAFLVTSGATAAGSFNCTLTALGTASLAGYSAGTKWSRMLKKLYTSAATAGTANGVRVNYAQVSREGGFIFDACFGHSIDLDGSQAFIGIASITGALSVSAASVVNLVNCMGMGFDTTDSNAGNWQFYRNDASGTCTKIDLGSDAPRDNATGFHLRITCLPGGDDAQVEIWNLSTEVKVLDATYDTDLPNATTGLCMHAENNNGAVAAVANLQVAMLQVQSSVGLP